MPIAWPTKSAQSGMRTLAVVLPEVTKSATSPTDAAKAIQAMRTLSKLALGEPAAAAGGGGGDQSLPKTPTAAAGVEKQLFH